MESDLIRKFKSPLFRKTALPFLIFSLLVLFDIIFVKFTAASLIKINDEVVKEKEEVATLSQKEATLRDISEGILSISDTLVIAVPAANPSLSVSSQLRNLANEFSVNFSGVSLGAPTTETNLSKATLSFVVSGDTRAIVNFFRETARTLPLTNLENLSIKSGETLQEGTATISAYWADLPAVIPSLSGPITLLSSEDNVIIERLKARAIPAFSQVLPQPATLTRTDPFR